MPGMAKVMIGELLVNAGLVTEPQVLTAVRGQRASGLPLGHYLIRTGVISEEELVRVLSHQLAVPVVQLDQTSIAEDAVAKVPSDVAVGNLIVPYKLEGKLLMLATADPTREDLLVQLRLSTMCDARFSLATPSAIDRGLQRAYGDKASTGVTPLAQSLRGRNDTAALAPIEKRLATLERHMSQLVQSLADSELVDATKFRS
jgi:type IV pilus assembly protein PilB